MEANLHRTWWVRVLNMWKLFLMIYFIAFTIDYGIQKQNAVIGNCFKLFLVAAGIFWVRQLSEKLYVYWIGHGLCVGFAWVLGTSRVESVLFLIMAMILSGFSWIQRIQMQKKRIAENETIVLLVVSVPCLIYGRVAQKPLIFDVFAWVGILFLWSHYINKYLANQESYLLYNKMEDKQNRGVLTFAGHKVMFLFGVLGMVVLLLGINISSGGLENRILKGIYDFIKWILHFIRTEREPDTEELVTKTPLPTITPNMTGVSFQQNKVWKELMEKIGAILLMSLKVFSVIFVASMIVLLLYVIWRAFYEKRIENVDEREKITPVVKERIKKKEKAEKRRFSFWGGNHNQKVRRVFRKNVEKSWESQVRKDNKTATELLEKTTMEEDSEELLLKLYQKARYSGENVSKEEWERCKKLERR